MIIKVVKKITLNYLRNLMNVVLDMNTNDIYDQPSRDLYTEKRLFLDKITFNIRKLVFQP